MKKAAFFIAFTAIAILTAFTLTSKDQKIIILDIGHGGKDPGAHVENTVEKEVNLKIAERIVALNSNQNIKFLLSRNGDEFKTIEDRIDFAKQNEADVFISIHANYKNDPDVNGIELYHGSKDESKALAEHFKSNLSQNHKVNKVQKAPFRVLNEIDCPGIMIESGFLSNQADLERLTSEDGQEKLAKAILKCIQ